ncbi:MAG: hypothetical protein AAGA58_01240 [Verrucomicrobiota bacterium]
MIEILLAILGIYLLLGLLVAVPFAFIGAKRIDPAATGGTWGFKLLVIPGAMVFWPLLLKRWIKNEPPPMENSAHR